MARRIRSGVEAIYSGAPVWWQAKDDAGQLGAGFVFGSIWDTDDNGVVLQFTHGVFYARFFITSEALAKSWNVRQQMFYITDAKLISMADDFHSEARMPTLPRIFCTRNKKAVPIWTEYYK